MIRPLDDWWVTPDDTDITRELHPAGTREQIAQLERELADARGETERLRSELATVKRNAAEQIAALQHDVARLTAGTG